jgi:hypothetical protein
VGNTGISQITGNVGTNSGAVTGFGNVNGVMHTADASNGTFTLLFSGDRTRVSAIEIFNSAGELVYGSLGYQSTFDLSSKPSGEYFVQIHLPSKTVNLKVVMVK